MQTIKIKSIKKTGRMDRYDLNIPSTNNFFANGILIHNTSARFTNQLVLRKQTWRDKIAKWFGVSVNTYEYDALAGSRRVVKDYEDKKKHDHFYDLDLWNTWLEKIKHVIPKNWVIYGEIIGYVGDKPIQKNYTYRLPVGENQLYVYRITIVNPDGVVQDLSWNQIVDFCANNGLKSVPEFFRCYHIYFDVDSLMNKRYSEEFNKGLPLDENAPCDEGVCIRREGLIPYVTKAKSPEFLVHETNMLDNNEVDMESMKL